MKAEEIVQHLINTNVIIQDPSNLNEYYLGITESKILKTALELIDDNGQTTTLEVKNELRENNYWATQSQISDAMTSFENVGIFDATSAGDHNVYVLAEL